MNFDIFQKEAMRTKKKYRPLSVEEAALLDAALGIEGEAGEVSDIIKHHIFHEESLDKMELAKEIGDVLWYMAALVDALNIKLDDVALLNVIKLRHRYSQGYDKNSSATRHEKEKELKNTYEYNMLRQRITGDRAPGNIIFIGPDGAGKTFLSKGIAEVLKAEYFHGSYQDADKFLKGSNLLIDEALRVYDRFYCPDEWIYATVKGRAFTDEEAEQFSNLEKMIHASHSLIIMVRADPDELKSRITQRGDEYVDVSELPEICRLYDAWLKGFKERGNTPVIVIDTTGFADYHFDNSLNALAQVINLWLSGNMDIEEGNVND